MQGPGIPARISAPMPYVGLAEEMGAQMQEVLRLVADGHAAEEVAAPALNPFLRHLVRGKLAPPASLTTPAVIGTANDGFSAGDVAGAADGHPATGKKAIDNSSAAAQKGITTHKQAQGSLPQDASSSVAPGIADKHMSNEPPSAGEQAGVAAAFGNLSSAGGTAATTAVGQDGVPAAAVKPKMWNRCAHVIDLWHAASSSKTNDVRPTRRLISCMLKSAQSVSACWCVIATIALCCEGPSASG